MRLRLTPALAALALTASACATAPGTERADLRLARGPRGDASPYGLFLAGHVALTQGRSQEAARYFAAAGEAEPDPALQDRAFTAALVAGDVSRAARWASESPNAAQSKLGRLTRAVEALAAGQGKTAQGFLEGDFGFPHKIAAAMLKPWAAAAAGDWTTATAAATTADAPEALTGLTRALLLERAKRPDEAEALLKQLAADQPDLGFVTLAYGELLERRGKREAAVELYDAALAEQRSPSIRQARGRAAAGARPPAPPTIREGAAQALLVPAAAFQAEKQEELALVYLRLALRLDPEQEESALLLGDTLAAAGDQEGAREAYLSIERGSPHYAQARSRLAWALNRAGEMEPAIAAAREAMREAPDDLDLRLTLADLLRAQERYAEAAQALDTDTAEARADWRFQFLKGVALDRAGRWSEAEPLLQAALKLRPEEPDILNYLGYSWIDKGVRLDEATAMIEKALAGAPESGAITDSLGWAHYKRGNYPEAVKLLEKAVGLEAGDPTVNDHLGDAYWRVGRRLEAQFQWRRALSLEPDSAVKRAAEAKLASPLGPDAPGASAAAAAVP